MWSPPEPERPPTPSPSARDLLVAGIENVMWTELERQADEGMGPYVDREMGMVDASGAGLDMSAVAGATVDALDGQLDRYRTFVQALVAETGVCPVCSYLWSECTCGVTS
jgi:hypothetical protein